MIRWRRGAGASEFGPRWTAIVVGAGALLFLGLALMLVGYFLYTPVDGGLEPLADLWDEMLALFLVLLVVSHWLLREGPSPGKGVLLSAVFLLPVSFFLVLGGAMALNGARDRAEATLHRARVVEKRARWRPIIRGGPRFWVEVRSWRRGREKEVFIVSEALYMKVNLPGTLRVETKPGWLGYEWVVSYGVGEGGGPDPGAGGGAV